MADYFFGYGSLVNTRTHTYRDPVPAKLPGWRRHWVATTDRELAFLSVIPDAAAQIDGLLAQVQPADWPALDEREYAYAKHEVLGKASPEPTDAKRVVLYAVPEEGHLRQGHGHPILLSYLDVVVQGFLSIFGEPGVQRFFDTTTGWEADILNDRAAPIYPRHQALSAVEIALVDHHLARLSAVVE